MGEINNMDWRTTYHTESTDGKTEHIICELWINFPNSIWNPKVESPIIKLHYHDRKGKIFWPETNYVIEPNKSCTIEFNYFQRQPNKGLYSGINGSPAYDDFNLDYCKDYAVKLISERLNDVINQLKK